MMTDAERREKNRLRSERWRRAHGIGPRKPAQRPWLAEGISRSTWYRRGNRISATVADLKSRNLPDLKNGKFPGLSRAEAFAAALARDLERCAMLHAVMARELAAAYASF
jgi:hypothetical protein